MFSLLLLTHARTYVLTNIKCLISFFAYVRVLGVVRAIQQPARTTPRRFEVHTENVQGMHTRTDVLQILQQS